MIRKVAGNIFLFPDEKEDNCKAPVYLNETGWFIFEKLKNGISEDEIAKELVKEYEVEFDRALTDVKIYKKQLLKYTNKA